MWGRVGWPRRFFVSEVNDQHRYQRCASNKSKFQGQRHLKESADAVRRVARSACSARGLEQRLGMVENGASGADGAAAKRPRGEEADGAAGTAAAPPAKKPALSLEALEKAKKALQLQKELKEKLKGLPQVRGTPSRDQLADHACCAPNGTLHGWTERPCRGCCKAAGDELQPCSASHAARSCRRRLEQEQQVQQQRGLHQLVSNAL